MSTKKAKIEVLEKKQDYLKLKIENTEPAFANALRRTILAEVPVMAIDEVIVYENTSPLFDEYLVHRLGLIPLTTDLKTYKMPEDCCGGNCSSCSAMLNIDESGPKMVYSSSIETNDPKIKPVSGKIPIIELMEGQRLRVEAKAILGRGEKNVKWQSGNASYKFMPTIEKQKVKNEKEVVGSCPRKILKLEKKKIKMEKPWDCTLCMICNEKADGEMEIGQDRTNIVFKIETNGNMTAGETLKKAIEILSEKNKNLLKEL